MNHGCGGGLVPIVSEAARLQLADGHGAVQVSVAVAGVRRLVTIDRPRAEARMAVVEVFRRGAPGRLLPTVVRLIHQTGRALRNADGSAEAGARLRFFRRSRRGQHPLLAAPRPARRASTIREGSGCLRCDKRKSQPVYDSVRPAAKRREVCRFPFVPEWIDDSPNTPAGRQPGGRKSVLRPEPRS
jgi:hypothetical protein